jgi:hypothetical protein
VAIKLAAELVPLLAGRVNRRPNTLPYTSLHLNTLTTLVDGSKGIVTELARQAYTAAGHTVTNWDEKTDAEANAWFVKDPDRAAKAIAEVWTTITGLLPETQKIIDGTTNPGDVRDEYLFAFGLGQRALAKATAQLMADFPTDWMTRLAAGVGRLDWKKTAPGWQGNAVIWGTDKDGNTTYRVNNTGPGITDLANRIYNEATK